MSQFSKYFKSNISKKEDKTKVINFMNGVSYTLNPLDTLFIVASSSIFGEKSYYRDNYKTGEKTKVYSEKNKAYSNYNELCLNEIFEELKETNKNFSTIDVFTKVIDEALDYDFKGTLELASELRNSFLMRLNPNIIFIRASIHKNRVEFNEKNPNFMKKIGEEIINIPKDMEDQLSYYIYLNGSKKGLPVIVKRVWTDKLIKLRDYHINKYKSKIIDLVRIADSKKIRNKNESINTLLEKGKIIIPEQDKTWEILRSSKKSWYEISKTIRIPHMALLRNLRNIFKTKPLIEEETEYFDLKNQFKELRKIKTNSLSKILDIKNKEIFSNEEYNELLNLLKNGVEKGKQFPYSYYIAYKEIEILDNEYVAMKQSILDTLEECIDISMANFPKLKGKTVCLSDNSGSAWGALNSEYGTVKVAQIANLSSVMTAYNSEEGKVVLFGDNIREYSISKRNGILTQLNNFNVNVGTGTEHGIWLFLNKAIKEKEHIDNLFIYSDMQAGHGGLYGKEIPKTDIYYYNKPENGIKYIDVFKMIEKYRKLVNPKINVYSVQVAGYNNSSVPENYYRTTILAGWTGKETLYASKMNDFWDEKDIK